MPAELRRGVRFIAVVAITAAFVIGGDLGLDPPPGTPGGPPGPPPLAPVSAPAVPADGGTS